MNVSSFGETNWLLVDVKTAGVTAAARVVEISAQRMEGWERMGEPFRGIINHDTDILREVPHPQHTDETLHRDGESPNRVYAALCEYARNLSVVGYDLESFWDHGLLPEWRRLGIAPIGSRGFCALRLAQRLLDPITAGSCKLGVLRQYFRLPERDSHTALGDLDTLADLFLMVLRPKAEAIGLNTWDDLSKYSTEEWYPSRFAFGQFKGHTISAAADNSEIREWLKSLAGSRSPANARIGAWYLASLERQESNPPIVDVSIPTEDATELLWHVVTYQNPELPHLQLLVKAAQARLAEVEAAFSIEKRKMDSLRAKLFAQLRADYERRDRLRLVVRYRKTFIEKLLHSGEEEAEEVREQFKRAEAEAKREYESTAAALEKKRELTGAQERELKILWKKLVKLFNPDRIFDDPDKRETYQKLTQAINHAKDTGDLDTLREIASDPEGFIRQQGWASVELASEKEIKSLRRLLEMLQIKIVEVIEATDQLKESPDYELYALSQRDPSILETVGEKQREQIAAECAKLAAEAEELARQVEELTGETALGTTEVTETIGERRA